MDIKKIKKFANGYVCALNLFDGKKIESTNTFLPMETELRGFKNKLTNEIIENSFGSWEDKNMIGISTQSGCPIRCKFCEVNKITEKQGWRNLSAEEMIKQVEIILAKTKNDYNYDIFKNPPKLFRILFTRMGEPSLNIDNVISAIKHLKDIYKDFPLRIQISTIGVKGYTEKLVEELIKIENELNENFIELQFSVHSSDTNFRKWLQTENILSNAELGKLAYKFYYSRKHDWKVTLNFALAKETVFEIEEICKDFDPNTVFIKLSPINQTETSEDNNIHSRFMNVNNI